MADEKIQVTIEGNPQGGIDMLTAFDKKADDSKKKLEAGSDVDKMMGGLAGKLTQLTLGFGTAAGAATAALGKIQEGFQKIIEIVPDAIKRTNELAASYQMMAVTAGMNSEQFNKFNISLQMSGGETEKMLPLIRGYARAMRTRADVLIANGIASDKAALAAMTFEQYIVKVVSVMKTYGDHMDRDLLLQAAFERSGIASAAMLENLARNFEEAGKTAQRNGIDMEEASKNLNTYRVATTELMTAFDKMKASLSSFTLPGLSNAFELIAKIVEAKGVLTTLAGFATGNVDLIRAGTRQSQGFVDAAARKSDDDYSRRREEMHANTKPSGKYIGDEKAIHEVSNDPFKAEADRLAQQEIRLRLKNTMAAEEKAELDAAEIQYRLDRDKLDDMMANQDKEMNRKESGMTPEIHHERYLEYVENWRTTQTQAEQAKAAIIEKFRQKRLDEEKKFEDELSVKGTDGLAQRYAKNQEWADKELKFIREHYEGEKRAQAEARVAATKAAADKHDFAEQLDEEKKLTDELAVASTSDLAARYAKIQEWEDAKLKKIRETFVGEARSEAEYNLQLAVDAKKQTDFIEQQKKDLSDLDTLLKQANERSPMSQAQTKKFIDDYGKGDASKKAASEEKTAELHLDGTAGQGALAGLQKFRAETENIYTAMQNLSHNLANSMSTGIGKAFTDMIVNGKKFGDAMKALWKDIASSVIGGLIQIATRQALNWALEGTIFAEKKIEDTTGAAAKNIAISSTIPPMVAATGASMALAEAEFWAAYGWIPGGAAIVETLTLAMRAAVLMAATPYATGGIIDRPTYALMGEAGPEIVAPQKDFNDWAHANQNLGYNLASHNASISGLQHQGNSYGKAGMAASGGSVGGAHVDLRGAVIAGESVDSARIIGNLVKKHMDGYNRRNG